ncbi:MAG: DUF262 domain-containing protein [Bacilli bacterium]|nr:DUF262 domain-containing protein [Bacilli bacterium]
MGYEIRPDSVKQFIIDRGIQLPRFQRKQTWDEKKNFQLVISIFKDYPMGVCIISNEKAGNKSARFLLDGRQRRNVFKTMYDNPDEICVWAKKFLGYKNSADVLELKELFDNKVGDYLESDDELGVNETPIVNDAYEDDSEIPDEITEDNHNYDYGQGLDLLFKIISTFYKVTKHYTGFSLPFDFNKYLSRVSYVDADQNNIYILNGTKLKTFIDEYRKDCDNNNIDYDEAPENFFNFILQRSALNTDPSNSEEKVKAKLLKLIKDRWDDILLRINLVDQIDQTLSMAKIGIIEVNAISSSDSQKIFNIINSEGVKLTAAEVLSASASWNKKINNPSENMVSATKELYDNMLIKVQDVVRWDVPATLLSRLGKNPIFKELSWDSKANKAEFEKKLTIGFKIFSGIFRNKITKDDISDLGKDSSINWDIESEQLLNDLKNMIHIIETIPYFSFLKSWKATIMDITSDTIALDFLLEMYFDWKRKGKPMGNSALTSKFQKNCIILLDRLIYEYINIQWRGSSDSKVARNIEYLLGPNCQDVFVPISREDWEKTLNRIKNSLFVNDNNEISYPLMKPLLYHSYCLMNISGPDSQYSIEIDHIIPQSLFDSTTLPNKKLLQHSLYNLGLLPKKENVSKGNERLRNIEDIWLKNQIKTYEFIPFDRFEEFSNINNYQALFDLRKATFFDKAFGEERDNLLNN